LDNDAFIHHTKASKWDESKWVEMLQWASMCAVKPIWCLVPDVVGDSKATKRNWSKYSEHVSCRGFKTAFAVQDGMTTDDVPGDADVVFVGGSTQFKWRTARQWTRSFQRVHVGRVNSFEKLWLCDDLGVESVDGTGWFRDPSDETKLPNLIRWLNGERPSFREFQFVNELTTTP
jgi:hypothetical protein